MSERTHRGLRIAALVTAGLAITAVALWHLSPVLLWHLRFEDQLREEDYAGRLHSELRTSLPQSPETWARLTMSGLHASLPLREDQRVRCAECAEYCILELDGGGSFAVLDGPPIEAYTEALDRFAPDSDDLSVLRSVASNWRTIDALTDRVRHRGALPETWRFRGDGSRGVVSAFHFATSSRRIVYAYAADGRPSRIVGVSGTSDEVFAQILGSVTVAPAADGAAECR